MAVTGEMVPIRVWAPDAHTMAVVTGQHTSRCCQAMIRGEDGWWEGPELPVGTDYFLSPNGHGFFPDPRSLCQPFGVHGPTRVWRPPVSQWVPSPLDTSSMPRGERGDSPSASDSPVDRQDVLGHVIYELHVGTFTAEGTLDAASKHLSDLAKLGVRTVELMPIAAFSGDFGWGYDGVDLMAVHAPYGGPDALVRFINRAHELGLAVCIDTVLNHVGTWGNYLEQFGPYFTDAHSTPWGPAINLDGPASHEVRRFLTDVVHHWLVDMHADAVRLDAVHALIDTSQRHFLQELSDSVAQWERQTGRSMTLIAESDLNDPRMVTATVGGGMGMDAQWADDIHHGILTRFTGDSHGYFADFAHPHPQPSPSPDSPLTPAVNLSASACVDEDDSSCALVNAQHPTRSALAYVLEHVFFHDGTWSSFREATWGAPVPDDMDRRRFIAYSQNHDQVGNRARGDRPSTRVSDGALAAMAALVLLGGATPMLFQGEEWGTRTPFQFFADQDSPENARLVREGRQREFSRHGWSGTIPDPASKFTRDASVLDWAQRDEPRGQRFLSWYRRLIEIRNDCPSVRSGSPVHVEDLGDVLILRNGTISVHVSLTSSPLVIDEDDHGRIIARFDDVGGPAVIVVAADAASSSFPSMPSPTCEARQ
ncbi:alpha-amylase family glycosyl hydrolase [Schaalia sp. ZJ1691]|uniref:alpha-amylase family glycosyl hydrolase n=1 Tax=Schaalia sp. ZJ1691 TaxID=2709404 RepID=UPI0013ED47AC|nr:alpha-amylase family glycosyl hydrolase [Schaalia sp. ZJ1691]